MTRDKINNVFIIFAICLVVLLLCFSYGIFIFFERIKISKKLAEDSNDSYKDILRYFLKFDALHSISWYKAFMVSSLLTFILLLYFYFTNRLNMKTFYMLFILLLLCFFSIYMCSHYINYHYINFNYYNHLKKENYIPNSLEIIQ